MAEARKIKEEKRDQELEAERQKDLKGGKKVVDTKFKALEYLLNQSKLYSTIMLAQMQRQEEEAQATDEKGKKRALKREETAEKAAEVSQKRATRSANTVQETTAQATEESATGGRRKSARGAAAAKPKAGSGKISDYLNKDDLKAKAGDKSVNEALAEEADSGVKAGDIGVQNLRSAKQPALVTGGLMRSYQLEGLEWLTSLYENGLNGILADEMGLGKTIQTISFLAFLREKGTYGPFLIASPLSTTSNWVNEFHKWTPDIPVVLYHGSKQEREEIRRKRFKNPGSKDFPVICTSYEICMNDRKFLANYGWKFIIIDEGHRIKNLNCRLIRELQSYQSANRLLITGTPLQNNLTELWSLLHFLMPTIFDKLESFESWFDFSALNQRNGYEDILSEERKTNLVTSLHAILKPFLLRRVKTDVETSLPKKREYVLYAPLTATQRELYQEILEGNSRAYLENKAVESLSGTTTPRSTRGSSLKRSRPEEGSATPIKSVKSSRASTPATTTSARGSRRAKKAQNYEELSDTAYFKQMQNQQSEDEEQPLDSSEEEAQEQAQTLALAKKLIGAKKLQNPVLQLRLCCNSPHNFFYPFVEEDNSDVDETLVTESGKMLLLDSLMPTLLKRGHKVLIFSQFKTQLDLIETYCEVLRGWKCSRIDGGVSQPDRQEQIAQFNSTESKTNIFLLSTRAGGQGINLTAADTVLLFDSDWNPQQDLQAQDRAHRIGQTRPVIVYRFATKGTVETLLLEKAESKRRLEKLVIQKGKFRSMRAGEVSGAEFAELQQLLAQQDGERVELEEGTKGLLSEEELNTLTDRSEEAYERAEKGLDGGDKFKAVETKAGGEGFLEAMSK
ncbi:SWI/SNF chromatin remodeling complex component [Aureobasidium melanogenum CBS 110374]|uniref:SWI/SNF chromatin remodeling complex component n=1 Tax=Aureobasidium melanogenum (strain CBS 110374) TaxID=1043003 RepID=A0A074VRC8_AURM1|nr:SWI/SNF chromatin remodeling complex component [Aureobasidium melanogenum CBS 110374]KEQ63013.1 SWI/SNF chromatin remodeling complex component [Aureobasidium melanogenum CBS 110374]